MLLTSYFQHFILHHFSMLNYILGSCTYSVSVLQRPIPTGFKPTITFGRSNQIASNSVCRYRGPIPIDLFCSLIFMPSVTEKRLCKVSTRFPLESRLYMYTEQLPFSGAHEYSTITIGRDNHTYKVTKQMGG